MNNELNEELPIGPFGVPEVYFSTKPEPGEDEEMYTYFTVDDLFKIKEYGEQMAKELNKTVYVHSSGFNKKLEWVDVVLCEFQP